LLFWHRFLRSYKFNRVMKLALADALIINNATSIYVNRLVNNIKRVTIIASVLQISFILYAWTCWAVPPLLQGFGPNFRTMHSLIMFCVIPPVIAVVLLNPFLFGIVAIIHYSDAKHAEEKMLSPRFAPGLDGRLHMIIGLDKKWISVEAEAMISEFLRLDSETRRGLAITCICEPLISAQNRLSYSCEMWGLFYVHVFCFALFQISAVVISVLHLVPDIEPEGHILATYFAKYAKPDLYMWYWTMIDLFHLVTALLLMTSFLCIAPMVTSKYNHLAHICIMALIQRHSPLDYLSDCGIILFISKYAVGWEVMNQPISSNFIVSLTTVGITVLGFFFAMGQG